MVTKNIKANTATQVNSNLIGVLVHPNINPPKVTVDDIVVDYTYTKFIIANGVPSPITPGTYTSDVITDTNNNVYCYVGDTTEVDGQTYHSWVLWSIDSSLNDNTVWTKDYPVKAGFILYNIDLTDKENPVLIGEVGTIGSLFLDVEGILHTDTLFIQISVNTVYNPKLGFNYYVDGDFLIDTHNGYKVGYVVSGPTVITDPNVTFTKGNVEEGYQTWTNEGYVSEGIGTLYTTTDSPAVGDKALFSIFEAKYEYNLQTIKSIYTTETPAVTDPVDCKLSYSVDGSTWTDWSENMTEDNNVIANIPRYVYLKFSQDVVITVE